MQGVAGQEAVVQGAGEGSVHFLSDVGRERGLWIALSIGAAARLVLALLTDRAFVALPNLWQLLDARLLREEPFTALYYLHMQPPLHNALLAAALALPDGMAPWALGGLYLALSFASIAVVYYFLRRWRFSAVPATLLATVFGIMPQVLLYESIFLYAHIEASFVLFAMYFAATYASSRRFASFAAFAACLALLALLRPIFHLGWTAIALVLVWWAANPRRPRDRRSLAAACVALLAVSAVYAKNYREFGFFGVSSWQGLAMAMMSLPLYAPDLVNHPELAADARQRSARGELSPATGLALSVDNLWYGWLPIADKACGFSDQPPALCAPFRSDGEFNYNHRAIIGYSKELGRDFWVGLRLYPGLFLRHVGSGAMTFLGSPSWDYIERGKVFRRYSGLWDSLLLYDPQQVYGGGRQELSGVRRLLHRLGSASLPLAALLIGSIAVVFAKGGAGLWRAWRGVPGDLDWIFPALVVLLFCTVPLLLNGIESNRIRYTIEPVLFLAAAIGVRGGWILLRRAFG